MMPTVRSAVAALPLQILRRSLVMNSKQWIQRCVSAAEPRIALWKTSKLVLTRLCTRKVIHGGGDNSNPPGAGVFLIRNALGTTAAHWALRATLAQVAIMERGLLVAVLSRDILFATRSQQWLRLWWQHHHQQRRQQRLQRQKPQCCQISSWMIVPMMARLMKKRKMSSKAREMHVVQGLVVSARCHATSDTQKLPTVHKDVRHAMSHQAHVLKGLGASAPMNAKGSTQELVVIKSMKVANKRRARRSGRRRTCELSGQVLQQ